VGYIPFLGLCALVGCTAVGVWGSLHAVPIKMEGAPMALEDFELVSFSEIRGSKGIGATAETPLLGMRHGSARW
jgi:hypothetical protein